METIKGFCLSFPINGLDECFTTLCTRGFSRVRREFNFRCWPKADTSAEATSGEAARKTSGTERCFLPSPLTFELFYRITFTPIRLKVSNCDHVGRHVKKCPKTHIILRKTSSSLKFIALRAIMTGSHRRIATKAELVIKG